MKCLQYSEVEYQIKETQRQLNAKVFNFKKKM